MLAVKYTRNIFLISVYISDILQQDICYVKVCLLKNWKQLFLSKLIPYLLVQEYGIYLFLFFTNIFTRYLQNIHEKKILYPLKYPAEKIWNLRNTHQKNSRPHEGTVAQLHKVHETHNGTRPTEFSTLLENYSKQKTYKGTFIS